MQVYKSKTLNDALEQSCEGMPDYSLQFARLKVLAFFSTYLLLDGAERTQMMKVEADPLSNKSQQITIDLINKQYDQLITKSRLTAGV